MSTTIGVKPRSSSRAAVRGADAAISTRSAPSGTTWQPGLLLHRAHRREQLGRDQAGQQQERPVGQRGHRGLQVQHPAQRHRDHGAAQRRQQGAQLPDALTVGPPAASHVDDLAGLEHVTALQRARRLDAGRPQSERADQAGHPIHFGPPRLRARPGQHGQVLAHHHGVLDEHRVRAVVGGGHRPDRPVAGRQRVGVGRVLGPGQGDVHRGAADVGDDPFGQPAAGRADQAGAVHGAYVTGARPRGRRGVMGR